MGRFFPRRRCVAFELTRASCSGILAYLTEFNPVKINGKKVVFKTPRTPLEHAVQLTEMTV